MLFENVQKLAAKPSIDKFKETSAISNLPEGLTFLFDNYDRNRPLPTLKGPIHNLDIGTFTTIKYNLLINFH